MRGKMKDNSKYLIQNTMRSLLNSFYTGAGLSFNNKIVYPYFCYDDKSLRERISSIGEFIESLEESEEKQNLVKKIIGLEKRKSYAKDITFFLSSYFLLFKNRKIPNGKKKIISIKEIDILAYPEEDMEYITVLKKLKTVGERLRAEKKGMLLLFGSLATKDYVKGHSDLDTVFIISKEACQSPNLLLQIRRDIAGIMRDSYFIDSLQHHGPYIFTEYDLDMFPQYYLPFAVWKKMVSFCGNVEIRFNERESSQEEIIMELQRYKEMFLRIIETPKEKLPKSNYSKKYLYQAILLFPAVYLLVKGKPCFKKDSFVLIRMNRGDIGNALLVVLSDVWRTNGFKTKAASPMMQGLFRKVSYPFCYPFISRLFCSQTLKEEQRKTIEFLLKEGAREYVRLIDTELKRYGNKKSR